jgi:hypothetical protein
VGDYRHSKARYLDAALHSDAAQLLTSNLLRDRLFDLIARATRPMYVITTMKTRSVHASTITDAQILWLRDKALDSRDIALAAFCDLALHSTDAIAKARAISIDRAWGLRVAARRECAASLNARRS